MEHVSDTHSEGGTDLQSLVKGMNRRDSLTQQSCKILLACAMQMHLGCCRVSSVMPTFDLKIEKHW